MVDIAEEGNSSSRNEILEKYTNTFFTIKQKKNAHKEQLIKSHLTERSNEKEATEKVEAKNRFYFVR